MASKDEAPSRPARDNSSGLQDSRMPADDGKWTEEGEVCRAVGCCGAKKRRSVLVNVHPLLLRVAWVIAQDGFIGGAFKRSITYIHIRYIQLVMVGAHTATDRQSGGHGMVPDA